MKETNGAPVMPEPRMTIFGALKRLHELNSFLESTDERMGRMENVMCNGFAGEKKSPPAVEDIHHPSIPEELNRVTFQLKEVTSRINQRIDKIVEAIGCTEEDMQG